MATVWGATAMDSFISAKLAALGKEGIISFLQNSI
jgi:hypothetical protein